MPVSMQARWRMLAAASLSLTLGAPGAWAHGSQAGAMVPETIARAHALSFLVATVFVLAGFTVLRRRWERTQELDAFDALVLIGIAWVVAAVSAPAQWLNWWTWKLIGGVLLAGTIGAAWWVVWERRDAIASLLQGRRRCVWAGVAGALLFLIAFAFVTEMVQFPHDGGELMYIEGFETFFIPDGTYGPLAFWSVAAVWIAPLEMMAQATFATGLLALALSGLVGVTTSVVVANITAGGVTAAGGAGIATLATSFCAGCTPALYAGAAAVLGSGATPVLVALGAPDLAAYNVAIVGAFWMLVGSIVTTVPGSESSCPRPP